MRTSFVALIRRHSELELASLLPESHVTRQWLLRAADRRTSACVWAVIDRSVAGEIADLLAEGEGVSALHRLDCSAEHLGPLLETCDWASLGASW